MTVFDQVAEFHKVFELPMFYEITPADDDLRSLRIRLLKEEYEELKQAVDDKDIVEIADALGDMTYIICGTALSYGIKSEGWEPEYFDQTVPTPSDFNEYPAEMNMRLVVVDLLYEAYERYEKHRHYDGIKQSLFAIMTEIAAISYIMGIPFKKVFDEIHRSNMTKIMPDGTVLKNEFGKVIKPKHFEKPDLKKVLFGN